LPKNIPPVKPIQPIPSLDSDTQPTPVTPKSCSADGVLLLPGYAVYVPAVPWTPYDTSCLGLDSDSRFPATRARVCHRRFTITRLPGSRFRFTFFPPPGPTYYGDTVHTYPSAQLGRRPLTAASLPVLRVFRILAHEVWPSVPLSRISAFLLQEHHSVLHVFRIPVYNAFTRRRLPHYLLWCFLPCARPDRGSRGGRECIFPQVRRRRLRSLRAQVGRRKRRSGSVYVFVGLPRCSATCSLRFPRVCTRRDAGR
jgi:hypothetical protein